MHYKLVADCGVVYSSNAPTGASNRAEISLYKANPREPYERCQAALCSLLKCLPPYIMRLDSLESYQ